MHYPSCPNIVITGYCWWILRKWKLWSSTGKNYRKSDLDKFHFQINQHKIAIVNNYTYLSVNFFTDGNFRDCKLNLKDKVRRSFSATHCFLDFTKIPLAETNKLFDSLFIPILLYGSEVWKIYKKDDFNTWEKDIIEEMHIFLCKQSLGVNKLCPNIAARNELGRLSLKLAIDANILKFYIHLQALPDNNIARQCLQLSVDMPEKTQLGMPPKIIKNLCDKYNPSSMILNMDNSKTFTCHKCEKYIQSFNWAPTFTQKNSPETELLQHFQNRHQKSWIIR